MAEVTLTRRTPMKRGGPLQRKSQPLRQAPMKAKPRKAVPAAEKRHMGRVAAMGCLVCCRPAEVHHVTSDGMKRITRTNQRVVGLCPDHHRTGRDSVENLSHAGFTKRHGIDLLARADELWRRSCDIESGM